VQRVSCIPPEMGRTRAGVVIFRIDYLDPSLAHEQIYHAHPSFILTPRTPPRNHVAATHSLRSSKIQGFLIQYHRWANPLAVSLDKFNQYKTDHREDLIRPWTCVISSTTARPSEQVGFQKWGGGRNKILYWRIYRNVHYQKCRSAVPPS